MSFQPRLEWVDPGVPHLTDPGARAAGVMVAFTGRVGGVSADPYATLNLSSMVGDDEAAVAENRARALAAGGFAPGSLAFLRQVHEADVLEAGGPGAIGDGDAVLTRSPGITPTILTADCVPVLLLGTGALGAAHAGWRGLVAGVIEAAVERVGDVTAAWVGPAIGACCYEVGPEVVAAFEGAGLPVADASHVSPAAAAATVLTRCGIEWVATSGICTSCDERFFSYRRDGVTGRQGALIAWS